MGQHDPNVGPVFHDDNMYLEDEYDSVKSENFEHNVQKSEAFYDSLRYKASKKRWTKELHDIFINGNSFEKSTDQHKKQQSITPFISYRGKFIRDILISKIDVFGPEVYDTLLNADSWLERWANKMHINTIDNILNNNIIIKKGEKLDPYVIADNERLLRELPYVNDARIYIRQTSESQDSVDLIFVIKDVWSKGFGWQIKDLNTGRIEIWDRNIFGTGHENQNSIIYDKDKTPLLGYEGFYKVKNIAGSFINSELNYISAHETKSYHIDIDRRFYTPNTKYGGGVLVKKMSTIDNFDAIDTLSPSPVKYNHIRGWVGRSFKIKRNNLLFKGRSNLVVAAGINSYRFQASPRVQNNFLYRYHNRNLILGSIAYSKQSYFKTNYIYNFGRTEDIPTGFLIKLTGGWENNDFKDRWYTALSISRGVYYYNFGYVYAKADIGGFLGGVKKIEQGVFHLKANYFTNLQHIGNFRFRQFVSLRYTKGINPYIDEYITINKKDGIRGFSADHVKDTEKLVLNLESVLFTPLFVYGFRFVTYGFADIAFVGAQTQNIFSERMFSGIGIGLRIRNEKLVFRTFQLQFAFYPNCPYGTENVAVQVSGEPRLKPDNFFVNSPEKITFK